MASLLYIILYLYNIISCVLSPRAKGNDFRDNVARLRNEEHLTIKEIAYSQGISTRTVQRYLRRNRIHGTPYPNWDLFGDTRGRAGKVTLYDLVIIMNALWENPSLYQDEIQQILIESGGSQLSTSTLCRLYKKCKITRKKLWKV